MDDIEKQRIAWVAAEARKTYNAIKKLKKTSPAFTRVQKDKLETSIKTLQDAWWNTVKAYMSRTEENHES